MARIGAGPFSIVDFWAPNEVSYGGHTTPVEGNTDRCACCGAKVAWRVIVENRADGKNYIVGRTCALKAASFLGTPADQLKADLKRREADLRRLAEEAVAKAAREAQRAAVLLADRATYLRAIDRRFEQTAPSLRTEWMRALLTASLAAEFEMGRSPRVPLFPELGRVCADERGGCLFAPRMTMT